MKLALKILIGTLLGLLLAATAAGLWYISTKQPQRSGEVNLTQLSAPVTVRYDEYGIPHIKAGNEADLYRALGYVHAQDRLFQMEMIRRLAQGELAEVLGPKLVKVDRLFRTLGLRAHAQQQAAALDPQSPAVLAQTAYLDGVNQFQASHPAPFEFDLLGIPKRPFTLQDTLAVSGYLAYSFAAAFKTEPLLTYVRDELGEDYLNIFDLDWNPQGVVQKAGKTALTPQHLRPPEAVLSAAQTAPVDALGERFKAHQNAAMRAPSPDWQALSQLAQVSQEAQRLASVPLFEGSNAWAVSGQRTSSGKPMLAGDPHIGFSLPAVWYEAHLSAPGFELYGNFQALNASALLGHNSQFGWSLTMFQNDDIDLIAEKVNPRNPSQVWFEGQWVELESSEETIKVKGGKPVKLQLQRSPNGPIISSAFRDTLGDAPVSMWWTFLQTDNPILEAFYDLNRANTLAKARAAASKIHAPGLNVVWANEAGDIGWWAAAKLPVRPLYVKPQFILDGGELEAEKLGFYRFSDNPQEENPARGYIVSANHQPISTSGIPIPGYYNLYDRAQTLEDRLGNDELQWNQLNTESLQLSTQTAYFWRVLSPLMPDLSDVVRDPLERSVFDSLVQWDGQYTTPNIPPTVFTQFAYELTQAAMADELDKVQFANLLGTRALDLALPRLTDDEASPWWDNLHTDKVETRRDIVRTAWKATIAHLKKALGPSPNDWGWGNAHTLTHAHPLAAQKPLDWVFNVGPFPAPGAHEVPNNLSAPMGPAPWAVTYGPSTRRIIDFANVGKSQSINPVGQSGVLFDPHYSDQAAAYVIGGYLMRYFLEKDVVANTHDTLQLKPVPQKSQ
ncbi:penicillin acylase family protein [Rhodoferax sp.]|uniref:penicillin acylase family protein n=1 Tax=Rhodoferax sp. TaxID=50421 RepID=UPI002639C724|nr:penicillin acylase family protein [Rhodoferax sp.]MDD2808831.1 penicillin acylase family protein [Rhodoferax sp.]